MTMIDPIATRFVDVWAILSILWATLCVAAYASGECVQFASIVCDVTSPIAALLIVGGSVVKIFSGFRKPAA